MRWAINIFFEFSSHLIIINKIEWLFVTEHVSVNNWIAEINNAHHAQSATYEN